MKEGRGEVFEDAGAGWRGLTGWGLGIQRGVSSRGVVFNSKYGATLKRGTLLVGRFVFEN